MPLQPLTATDRGFSYVTFDGCQISDASVLVFQWSESNSKTFSGSIFEEFSYNAIPFVLDSMLTIYNLNCP